MIWDCRFPQWARRKLPWARSLAGLLWAELRIRDLNGKAGTRYFMITAGIGVDAHLFYQLNPLAKRRLGMAAYYAKATRLVAHA